MKLDRGCPNGTNTPTQTFVISQDLFRFKVKFFSKEGQS